MLSANKNLDLSDLYKVSSTDKVHDMELELKHDLEELKNEIEENDGLTSRTVSSVPLPKDIEHFRMERKLVIQRVMQVSEGQPLRIQAEVMKEEMLSAEVREYTPKSVPLLLHQYFTERIQQLVVCKHQHMLRWKRFCQHTSTIESLHPLYQKRLTQIVNEYNDCTQRAYRLAAAHEAYICNRDNALSTIKLEDLLIYLRWFVSHLHSMNRFHQYLKILQWLPVSHKTEMAPPDKMKTEQGDEAATKMASRYQEDTLDLPQGLRTGISRPGSAASSITGNHIPHPPPMNPTLLSTSPLPSSVLVYAAAAAGGGLATDEASLGLPLNVIDFQSLKPHLSFLFNVYGLNTDLDQVHNTADEMEMFAAVNRKFKQIFTRQELMKTYKYYDHLELGEENWGRTSPVYCLKMESNWLAHMKLKPKKDLLQEKIWTNLKQKKKVDELLRLQSHFIDVVDPEKIMDVLREHASAVQNPRPVNPASVTSHKTQHKTSLTWKKIYSNPHLYYDTKDGEDETSLVQDIDERDIESVNLTSRITSSKRKDSYDYVNTIQMLGLDEGEQDQKDPATVQGAYLSYLHLRHLRLRDLQRTCLGIFNYFRSLQRTLTINDVGLSQESGHFKNTSAQDHRRATEFDGTIGGGGGLGSHAYMHNTPKDFKLNESEFIEFDDVENHDDFYTVEDGRVHVQDQRGLYIMYEAALEDMEKLKEDMLLIASQYIEKDRELRNVSRINKHAESARRRQQQQSAGDFDIGSYAHQEVDRFGVLLDFWSNEAAFLECKRELIDCYIEAYQHVFDRDERRALAQLITDIMFKRPRFDTDSNYFIKMYRAECVILRQKANLIRTILDRQIDEQREYIQRVCREGDTDFGLPHRIIPRQLISVNLSRSSLKNVYMLEFHPSLAIASKIPEALDFALKELLHVHRPTSTYDALLIEKKLLEIALSQWEKMEPIGASYSPQIQKDLFSDAFAEDPLFMCEIAQTQITQREASMSKPTAKERLTNMVNTVCQLFEALTIRNRLIDAAWEVELLAKLYKKQATEMGFDEYHLYIRNVQFEYAKKKEDAGKPPPIFITAVHEDDSAVDRYSSVFLNLAIQELDESHVGRFSFRTREGLLQILREGGSGLKSLQVVLKSQIVQKNALTCAIQQVNMCQPMKNIDRKSGRASPTETKSEKSTLTQMTGFSSGTGGTALAAKLQSESSTSSAHLPESFVSIQLEKTPSRDMMLNAFCAKSAHMGSILRNAEEMEKLKRSFVSDFCYQFNRRISQYSLRGQIIGYYNSILGLLENFPNVRDTYFMMGEPNEKKTSDDDVEGLEADPRILKSRPRRVLSADGKDVLNIWFIPHHSEALVMHKKLEDEMCVRALSYTLMIVAALHDMLQYLCAHSKLGSSHARLGSRKMEFVSADWGGTEGIGAELREIQKQINALPNPQDPKAVSDLLTLRKDVMFLEFDTAVRHCMRDTFLSTGNTVAFKSITNNMHHAIPALSNIQRPSVFSTYLTVPEPLESRDFQAKKLFPWRAFLGRNGPFPVMLWQWFTIEDNIQVCLAGLRDVDRHVANGEILGVTLLMEDVLQTGYQDVLFSKEGEEESSGKKSLSRTSSSSVEFHRSISSGTPPKGISRNQEPIESYRLLKFFLLLWKCLEILKYDWGKKRMAVECIETSSLYKDYCKLYKNEMLLIVLQGIARRLGHGDFYEGIVLDTDPLVMPRGASEIEVRAKQLIRLLENLECHMITELRKKITKESSLVLAERGREESALPTDLWKRSSMKETYTITKPHVAENFEDNLMSKFEETETEITFTKEHLNSCLAELAREVMAREKHNYESYSMYYENLLRVHHHLLYQREQEVKQLRSQLRSVQASNNVDVQCQLASQAHDLLMEITALRAKIGEMREMSLTQERDVRERFREEYEDLIQNLFNTCFQLKTKLDEFRNDLYDDVFERVRETRREAVESMKALKEKYGSPGESGDKDLKQNLVKADRLRDLQHENHTLNALVLKMKAMNNWKHNHSSVNFFKTIGDLKKDAENSKKEYIEVKMMAEEEVILLRQQLIAIRKGLEKAEKECNEVKKHLDRELKEKMEKTHEALQKAQNQQQLHQVKQSNIETLLEELEDKETRLKYLTDEHDKSTKMQLMLQEKVRKDIEVIKNKLSHERNLKLDAFQRVDELQSQIYDIESCMISRSQSAITYSPAPTSKSRSRVQSAKSRKSMATSRSTASSGIWPPPVVWPANRSLTPDGGSYNNNFDHKKMLRPKTVGGRLRSRIAEQLLNDLEQDGQQAMVQLEELQLEGNKIRL